MPFQARWLEYWGLMDRTTRHREGRIGADAVRRQRRAASEFLEDRTLLTAPQTFIVTNLLDSGTGSLRAAVASANADSYTGSAYDTIQFDPSLAGQTINLTTVGDSTAGPSALAITAPVLIDGSTAPGLTIASASAFRILSVGAMGKLTLQDLTISGGQDNSSDGGGGLYNSTGTATLTNVTFTNNSAQNRRRPLQHQHWHGHADQRRLHQQLRSIRRRPRQCRHGDADQRHLHQQLRDRSKRRRRRPRQLRHGDADQRHLHQQLRSNRRRPLQCRAATLTNATFTNNSAQSYGGGLLNSGTATLTNATFTSNSAQLYGGGLVNYATATPTNVTVTNNSAPTGGGLYNSGTATLNNTIVAGNFLSGSSYPASPREIEGTVSGAIT